MCLICQHIPSFQSKVLKSSYFYTEFSKGGGASISSHDTKIMTQLSVVYIALNSVPPDLGFPFLGNSSALTTIRFLHLHYLLDKVTHWTKQISLLTNILELIIIEHVFKSEPLQGFMHFCPCLRLLIFRTEI